VRRPRLLAGSGTADYRRTGAVCGIELPSGLLEASQLPEPIFTPATKAELGDHDENVGFEQVAGTVGQRRAEQLRDATLRIYARAAGDAATRGLILADTKFEFGLDPDPDPDAEDGYGDPMLGDPMLGDEVLTPDSSRYWPAEGYAPGSVQPAFDKQYVREWLTSPESGWDRHGDTPPPPLPDEVIAAPGIATSPPTRGSPGARSPTGSGSSAGFGRSAPGRHRLVNRPSSRCGVMEP
jgi:phosphoribosylaminoimidazole-succinocarboxamide synthase